MRVASASELRVPADENVFETTAATGLSLTLTFSESGGCDTDPVELFDAAWLNNISEIE